jgi:hypothetical protein
VGREYILDILMREEPHWADNALRAINVAERFDQIVQFVTKKVRWGEYA